MTQPHTTATARDTPGRPAPAKSAAYWAHIRAVVDAAPPLTDTQRARIRAAFHQPGQEAAA
ncbi:hypothetical protein [Streptomyces albidoflavus]|uniref:hypothetical protein n=1 Tax=Streptomyces albidoflavus TaxID=1886 RepID=UPI00024947F0